MYIEIFIILKYNEYKALLRVRCDIVDINKEDDMDVFDFARKICMCSIDTPISLEFDRLYGQKKDVWWACQREHLTAWCLYQPTSGFASYKHKPNRSTRKMYNYFNCPGTLL